jgi:tetratricopeptide (TPR) repeat protein
MKEEIIKRKFLLSFIAVFCIFVIASGYLFGTEGRIKGKVIDENLKPLANVKITLIDRDRGIKYECQTDEEGNYYHRGIKPSTYEIIFEKDGYIPIKDELRIRLGSEEELNVVMKEVEAKVVGGNDFLEAEKLYKEEKYQEAADAFQRVIEGNPAYAEAYANLGRCYLKLEQFDQAIENLDKAVELKPTLAVAFRYLGEALLTKGETDKGKEALTKASELETDDAEFHYNLGATFYNYDLTDEAIAEYLKALKLDDKMSNVFYQLGWAYFKKGELEKSIESFEKFLESNPKSPQAPEVKGVLEELKKQSAKKENER